MSPDKDWVWLLDVEKELDLLKVPGSKAAASGQHAVARRGRADALP